MRVNQSLHHREAEPHATRRSRTRRVDANPLEDIRNTARISAVAVGGNWLERPALDRMIAEAGERLNP